MLAIAPHARLGEYLQKEMLGHPPPVGLTEEHNRAYRAYRSEMSVRAWRMLLLPTAGLLVLWWPEDWLLYDRIPGAPRALGTLRAVTGAYAIALYMLFPRIRALRAHASLTLGSAGVLFAGVAGYEFGNLGGPSSAWFHFGDIIVMVPVVIGLSLRQRIATTSSFGCALLAGYFVGHPDYLHDPMTGASASYLVGLVALSIAMGELAEWPRRRAFFLQIQTESQAAELRGWSETLERRVEEQSAELRALLTQREADREAERGRLALELHDELGQELTALRLALELTRHRFKTSQSAIEPNLVEMGMLLDRGRQTLRNALLGLRPLLVDDLGLVAAFRWLAESVTAKAGLKCELHLPEQDPRLSDHAAVALFRILQESLTNVVRHARATQVVVSLADHSGCVELKVTDDGAGFAPRERSPLAGLGLVGVRERARAIGGIVDVTSAPGRGTSVAVRVEQRS